MEETDGGEGWERKMGDGVCDELKCGVECRWFKKRYRSTLIVGKVGTPASKKMPK